MKKSRIVWLVLGGLALVILGFASGFLARSGGVGFHRGLMGGAFPLMIGLGLLARLLFCLGPLAGIAALVIVLTRRNSANAAPVQSLPPASETAAVDATSTAVSVDTPPMPIKKK